MTIGVGGTAAVERHRLTLRHRDARDAVIARGFGAASASGLAHRAGRGGVRDGRAGASPVTGNTLARKLLPKGSIAPRLAVFGACGIGLEDHIHVSEAGAPWFDEPARGADDPFGLEARR